MLWKQRDKKWIRWVCRSKKTENFWVATNQFLALKVRPLPNPTTSDIPKTHRIPGEIAQDWKNHTLPGLDGLSLVPPLISPPCSNAKEFKMTHRVVRIPVTDGLAVTCSVPPLHQESISGLCESEVPCKKQSDLWWKSETTATTSNRSCSFFSLCAYH